MKHKRTKFTAISPEVKQRVLERDKVCIICGSYGFPVCHVVNRSQGGEGIEQNIVTLCPRCHNEMDNGKDGKIYRETCEEYLKMHYPGWTRESVKYDKWRNVWEN